MRPRILTSCSSSLCALALLLASPRPVMAAWTADGGPVVVAAQAQTQPVLAPDAAGGVYFAWVDARTGFNTDIRSVRWDANGSAVGGWTPGGDLVTYITCQKYDPAAIADGSGGALFAWADDRCTGYRNIYARRVGAAGIAAAGWASNGVRVAPTTSAQLAPSIAPDGAGGAFIAWQDLRGADADIYLQHVDGAGAIASGWPASGLAIAALGGVQTAPVVTSDGSGGVFVAWQDRRGGQDDIYLQRVLASGSLAPAWPVNGLLVCGAAGDQGEPSLDGDGSGGALIAWRDRRGADSDLYAARLLADGAPAPGWSANGSPLCTAPGDQAGVRLIRDGAGGLLAAWQDRRTGDWDVRAGRLSGTAGASPGWLANGVLVSGGAGDQTNPVLTGDGAGGGYFAWQDQRTGGSDIWAVRLDGNAAPPSGWTAGGTVLCGAPGEQGTPRIAAAAGGGAYVVWTDARNGTTTGSDVYALRLLGNGPVQVRPSGLAATHRDGQTFLTWDSPPSTGWTHRIYFSPNPITVDSDLDGATLLGSVGDSSATDARLSGLLKVLRTFRTDSAAAPLPADKGLFVVTVPADRAAWYAVTSQLAGGAEDRHVIPGGNALLDPVGESLALPRPVYQGTVTADGTTADLYTLWTWPADTPLMPATSNRASWPYDCSVTRGAPQGPAFMRAHALGGNFTQMLRASGAAEEWVVALDDYTRNSDLQTFWYGHHAGYDITSNANVPPLAGPIIDYTNRRVLHTIRWARATFDFDTTRCYGFGYSLGGTYVMQLAFTHPELIAASMASIAKADYSFESDPNPLVAYNPGGQYRLLTARLWGTVAANLPTSEGLPVYTRLNDDSLAARFEARGAVFHANFSGKNDESVGWAEKIGFYQSIEAHRQGGVEFWDNRDHSGFVIPSAFAPMLDLRYLYRFRSNLSWPAFSNCSRNGDPGNGAAASGDSLGTINGFMDWDPAVSDSAGSWRITLSTRSLATRWGTLAAPESLTVDVTPRRLQRFTLTPGAQVQWSATRLSDGALVQSGTVTVDALGLVTVPQVRTYRTGTRLSLGLPGGTLDAPPGGGTGATLTLSPFANPVRGRTSFAGRWPSSGAARVELFDPTGRRVRTLHSGWFGAGPWSAEADLSSVPPGVYMIRATQGEAQAVRRLVLLR